jgi:preprotein translocase subunit SecG
MGIAFGGAGSQTVFGSSGAGNFLTRLTSATAAVFLMTSLSLAHYSSQQDSKRLQKLATERAAEKKVDDEKAAKLKADLEKARAAAAPAPGAATTETPGAPGLQLKAPELLETSGKKPTGVGSTAPAAGQAAPNSGAKPGATTPPASGAGAAAPKAVGAPAHKPKPPGVQAVPTPAAPPPTPEAPAPAQVP